MAQRQLADEPRAESASASAAPVLKAKNAQTATLLLAGALCVLPFLLPYNQLFEAEWLAAALGTAAALAALAVPGASVLSLPAPARWLLAFALFLGVQTAFVHPVYAQVPLLAALYVLYAALLIWLGAQLAATNGLERAATLLAACLLAGGLANAASGVIQFYGTPALLQDAVAELLYPFRAYGNIAQPNLYANYLALGGTALLFLWLRRNLRTGFALAAAMLLAWGFALSGSRTVLLYVLWYGLLGLLARKVQSGSDGRRLSSAAFALAAVVLVLYAAVPWLNTALKLSSAANDALDRMLPASVEGEPRWQMWLLAWHVFTNAPLFGVGIGEFAGAAFRSGLSPNLTRFGQVWTSAHNLPLQLLAETGVLGAFLALGAVCTWCWQAGRRYVAGAQAAMWWIIAAVGIELIHSMVEFPLWSAHFLGVTALLMGLATQPGTTSKAGSRLTWTVAAGSCAALALATALLLRDYVRLSATRVTGTRLTLASAAETARDAAVMRALTRGLLAPPAEYWIILGAPLDRSRLTEMLKMSERVARSFPAHAVIVRRAVFLAFDGQAAAARRLLAQAMYSFPRRCRATIGILSQALAADPHAIEPLLTLARNFQGKTCR
jgi:Virulence factor membrane-bound polymerase, C-terminal/O-Antigen ligase